MTARQKMERRLFRTRVALGGVSFLSAFLIGVVPAKAVSEPLSLYGTAMSFDVLRNGTPVGLHTVTFSQDESDLIVEARFSIAVKFLMFTAYSFDYSSNARWRGGKLLTLTAQTDDDGEVGTVTARREEGSIRVANSRGETAAVEDVLPTNHWNSAVTESSVVLNTITGKLNKVRMLDLGMETVVAEGIEVEARRWAYSGELNNEVWYDDRGRWVKMRFEGRDGSTIEYVCTRCLGGSASTARQ